VYTHRSKCLPINENQHVKRYVNSMHTRTYNSKKKLCQYLTIMLCKLQSIIFLLSAKTSYKSLMCFQGGRFKLYVRASPEVLSMWSCTVVLEVFAVPVSVLWVGLQKSKQLNLDVKNNFCRVTYWAPLEML
jgi:hypothetical protein